MAASNPKFKKKPGKEAVTTLQFGKGTRTLFDFFQVSNLIERIETHDLQVGLNLELASILTEVT